MEKKLTTDFYSNCLIFCVFTVIFIPNWTLFIRCCKMMVTGLSVNGAPHTVLKRGYNAISSVSQDLSPLTRSGMERNMFEARTDKKTAIFFADGCEEIEGLTVVDLLYRAGIPCTKVSINDQPEVTSSHEITFRTDTTVKELPFDEYDMLILPGGVPGTPNLRACGLLMNQVVDFCRNGKQIAAICAAPGIFAELGLLKGIKAACNPTREEVLRENGAILSHDNVVVSGNIITSRAMGTAIPFGLAIVAHYLGEDAARSLGENVLYYT